MDAQLWCAVYTSDEDGYMCDSVPVGMLINPSGSCIDWDRETYPYLCQLDNRADTDSWHISEDTEKMETHFYQSFELSARSSGDCEDFK